MNKAKSIPTGGGAMFSALYTTRHCGPTIVKKGVSVLVGPLPAKVSTTLQEPLSAIGAVVVPVVVPVVPVVVPVVLVPVVLVPVVPAPDGSSSQAMPSLSASRLLGSEGSRSNSAWASSWVEKEEQLRTFCAAALSS